jgi:hypothetical protein
LRNSVTPLIDEYEIRYPIHKATQQQIKPQWMDERDMTLKNYENW